MTRRRTSGIGGTTTLSLPPAEGCSAARILLSCVLGVLLSSATIPIPLMAQPRLVLRDSIVLEQTGESYIAQPLRVTPDDGGYLVVDGQQAQVFRFDPTGKLVQRYGRKGEGPGEFREAAVALPYGPEDIIVFSWLPPAAQIFDRESGEFQTRYDLGSPLEEVAIVGNRVWVSGVRYGTGTSLRRVTLGGGEDAAISLIPSEYVESGPLGGIFHRVPFALWADTLLVGFEPLDRLFLVSPARAVIDTLTIPSVNRRGTPARPREALVEALERGPYREVFAVLSTLREFERRSDGSFVLVYSDHRPAESGVTSELFVTVLDSDRTRACVDASVPLGADAQPAVGFAGNDLLVIEQVLVGLDAVPVLKRFSVDVSACDWLEVGQ